MIKRDNLLFSISTKLLENDSSILVLLLDTLEKFYDMLDMKDNKDINSDLFYYCYIDEHEYNLIEVEAMTSINRKAIRRFMDSCNNLISKMIISLMEYYPLRKYC